MFALKEMIKYYPHENSNVLHYLREQLLLFSEYWNDFTNNSKIMV